MRIDANCVADLRRDERSRVPHTTHARRLREDNYQMPQRARRLTMRPRSSWLSTATRHIGVYFRDVWVVGNLWAVFFSFLRNNLSMLCSTRTGRYLRAGSTSTCTVWRIAIIEKKSVDGPRASAVYKRASCKQLIENEASI